MKEGDFFKRNEDLLRDVIRERNYEISEQEIKELNEMSVLIYRGMLAIMRSDRDKPTVDEAVDKTVRYLAKTCLLYTSDIENAEVEDLIPFRLIERGINRIFHDLEDMYFEDEYEEKSAIVPQIEEFASKNNVALEKGWKVEVARNMKHMLKNKNIMQEIKDEDMEIWKKIFIDFDK